MNLDEYRQSRDGPLSVSLDTALNLLEEVLEHLEQMESLAVCSSGEGTCFYYKDAWEADRERIAELEEVVDKLPKTADGVSVVPNADPIWILPDEPGGWAHDEYIGGSYDEEDNCIPPPPTRIDSWAYYGDHLWVGIGLDEGDHWFGQFFSSAEAAQAAKENKA